MQAHDPLLPTALRDYHVAAPGASLHCVETGAGPPLLLLHGFPDFWYGWRHQLKPLADAGYRVIAADLRGYNASSRPSGVHSYAMDLLVDDVVALLQPLRHERPVLVGHDWGGVIAWHVAARRPELLRRLVILNAPHPAAYRRELLRNPRQALRSWYAVMNQLPLLPEAMLRARDHAVLRRVIGRGDGLTQADPAAVERYVEVFSQPGAKTAALNYYRAAGRALLRGTGGMAAPITMPALVIWGERDAYLDVRLLHGLERWVPDVTVERLPHAGHFVHWQDPGTVNALISAFAGG